MLKKIRKVKDTAAMKEARYISAWLECNRIEVPERLERIVKEKLSLLLPYSFKNLKVKLTYQA